MTTIEIMKKVINSNDKVKAGNVFTVTYIKC